MAVRQGSRGMRVRRKRNGVQAGVSADTAGVGAPGAGKLLRAAGAGADVDGHQ